MSRLEWNSNLTCNITYCMYIPCVKLISQDIWRKSPENFEKSKTHKNNRWNSENNIFTKHGTYVEMYTAGLLCTKFEEYILIYEAMIAKNGFDIFLAVNYVKVTQLWCNSNSTCRATYWMYIASFKLISQSMMKKSPENADGRTDGRTDIATA